MRNGDLSDRLPPRWLFVYEGVIGFVPLDRVAYANLMARARRWKAVVACYDTHPHVSKVLWDLYWRRDYRFDIITFHGEGFRAALEARLDRDGLPYGNCWAVTEEELTKRLAYMPDVQAVVHGDDRRLMAYGQRGMYVGNPGALNIVG